MRHVSRILLAMLLLACTAGCAAPTAGVGELGPTSSWTGDAADVTVVLKFDDCEGCVIQPQRYVYTLSEDGNRNSTEPIIFDAKPVKNGEVTWLIPRINTKGLVFAVVSNPDGSGAGNARALIGVYTDTTWESTISPADALKKKRANPCLGGSDDSTWTLHVATQVVDQDPNFGPIRSYWISPIKVAGLFDQDNAMDTFKGGIGAQDTVPCRVTNPVAVPA